MFGHAAPTHRATITPTVARTQIALGFFQVLVSFSQTFHIDLPEDIAALIGYFQFLTFDWTDLAYPAGCINGWENTLLLITSLSPLTVAACVIFVVWATECKLCRVNQIRTTVVPIMPNNSGSRSSTAVNSTPSTSARKQVAAVCLSLLIVFICLPSVSRAIFSTWVCEQYEVAPGGEVVSFLLKDPTVECSSHTHNVSMAVAVAMLLLWPVGMFVLFFFILFFNRKDLRAGVPRSTSGKAAHFLTSGFRDKFFYWELVELLRRLLVTGWLLLIPFQEMFTRLVFALLVSVLFLTLTAVARPWSRTEDNVLALVSQCALVVAFGACLVIKIVNVPGAVYKELDALIGLPSLAAPFFVLCFVALGFLFVLIAMLMATAHRVFSSLAKKQASSREDDGALSLKFTSAAFSIGACLLGLPAGALGGYAFGILGGVIGAAALGSLGAVTGVAVGTKMRRYAQRAMHKLHLLRYKEVIDELLQLEIELQDVFDDVFNSERKPKYFWSARSKRLGSQLMRVQSVGMSQSDNDYAGKHVRKHLESIRRLVSREEAVDLLTMAATRIREPSYSISDFHVDMVKCFPELQLYLGGNEPAADTVEASAAILKNKGVFPVSAGTLGSESSSASSGRTGHVEYCRTFGALFCVYWLMRLELDEVDGSEGLGGQSGFCFGVNEDTWEATPLRLPKQASRPPESTGAVAPSTEESKKRAFLLSHNWLQLHALMVDAGLLTHTEGGGAVVCIERTRAMLALTAYAAHSLNSCRDLSVYACSCATVCAVATESTT